MPRFADFRDWQGDRFDGNYDGRRATLRIGVLPIAGSRDRFGISLNFTDVSGQQWNTPAELRDFHFLDHVVTDLRLVPSAFGTPNRRDIAWPRLFIHTWDINFLSGYSRWEGKDYGMSWTRSPLR